MDQPFQKFKDHVAWTSEEPIGLTVDRAEGPYLILDDGRRVIDLISGIAVSSLGHGHPSVLQAIRDQVDRHLHVMVYGELVQRPQAELAAYLADQLPSSLQVVYFTMTGTEANEGALKLAKKYTGRSRMVAFERSYHGDTHGSLSVTGRDVYRKPFEPLLPGVSFLPFNDRESLDAIDRDTACVIAEPVQGEGGVRVASAEWLRALRARCTEVGALLIFDEIQTGLGRTGSLFAFEHFGVTPDILTLAKAFGGGMPLGAFVSSADVFATFRKDPPLSHVTTFGGHPVSCAAALASLRVLVETDIIRNALRIERVVRKHLVHANILEIRGLGAMLGADFRNGDVARRVVRRSLANGVLLGSTLHSESLVRISPPLTISEEILRRALGVILDSATDE